MTDPIAKKAALEMLTAANALAKAGFSRIGAGGGPNPDSASTEATVDRMAKDLQKASGNGMTFEKAYAKVLEDNPEIYGKMKAERKARVKEAN